MGRPNLRLLLALAPGMVLGPLAVLLADRVEPASARFILQFLAIGAVADMSWRVGAAALGGTITRAHGVPERLRLVTNEHRRTTFDPETGLHAEWFFRLRVDEEIARSKRYGMPFCVIMVVGSAQVLDAVRITMKQWLREIDYAGDLGEALALCLPNTDRRASVPVIERLTGMVQGLHVSLAEFPSSGDTVAALLGEGEMRHQAVRASAA